MLKSTLAAVAAVFAISAFSPAMAAKGDPHVLLTTSAGNIELELNSQKAPISVDNFLKYKRLIYLVVWYWVQPVVRRKAVRLD